MFLGRHFLKMRRAFKSVDFAYSFCNVDAPHWLKDLNRKTLTLKKEFCQDLSLESNCNICSSLGLHDASLSYSFKTCQLLQSLRANLLNLCVYIYIHIYIYLSIHPHICILLVMFLCRILKHISVCLPKPKGRLYDIRVFVPSLVLSLALSKLVLNFSFFFIVVDFVIHWNETAMGSHVFPIPIPPPTSLSTRSL